MPVRSFDGVDDHITTAIGSLNFAFGPGTIAAIVRRDVDGSATETIIKVGTSATTAQYQLQLSSAGRIQLQAGSSALGVVGLNLLAADGWCLIAATKASGSVAPRIHKYVFSTEVWTHTNAASNLANSGTPATSARFGATQAGGAFFNGDIGYAGVSNTVLSDSAIEALVASAAAWDSAGFVAMWPFTQAATTDPLQDTIGAADQTSINGTTVIATDVPWPSGGEIEEGSGDLDATSSLSGSAKIARTGGGSLSGASSLSGTASRTQTAGGSLSATSGLSGSASRTLTGSGDLAGDSDLDGAGGLTRTGTGALSSTSSLEGSAAILAVVTGEGSMSSTSTLAGSASLTLGGYGALSGTSTLAGTVNGVWAGSGAMSAEASLVGGGTLGAEFGPIKMGRISDVREGRISHVRTGRIS